MQNLIHEFVRNFAAQGLKRPLALFKRWKDDENLVLNRDQFVNLAIDCLFALETVDNVEMLRLLLACLPDEENLNENLLKKLKNLNSLIDGLEFLQKLGISLTVKKLQNFADSELDSVQLLIRMANTKTANSTSCKQILNLMLKVRKICLPKISEGKKRLKIFLLKV